MPTEQDSGKPLCIAKLFQIASIIAIIIFANVLYTLPFSVISELILILVFPVNKRWQQLLTKITESSYGQ
jgi:hypothetical protein